eukprot:scaffold252240_cov42-Prasinocladus_malaysianus.AAC.1
MIGATGIHVPAEEEARDKPKLREATAFGPVPSQRIPSSALLSRSKVSFSTKIDTQDLGLIVLSSWVAAGAASSGVSNEAASMRFGKSVNIQSRLSLAVGLLARGGLSREGLCLTYSVDLQCRAKLSATRQSHLSIQWSPCRRHLRMLLGAQRGRMRCS